jgi:hypothetical protein
MCNECCADSLEVPQLVNWNAVGLKINQILRFQLNLLLEGKFCNHRIWHPCGAWRYIEQCGDLLQFGVYKTMRMVRHTEKFILGNFLSVQRLAKNTHGYQNSPGVLIVLTLLVLVRYACLLLS